MVGMAGAEADAYAKEVVMSDFEEPGDDDVLRKVVGDFEAKAVSLDRHKVRLEMDRLLPVAKQQIMSE